MLAAIAGDEGGKDFLEGRERAGGQHFGAEGVGLELLEVGLDFQCQSCLGVQATGWGIIQLDILGSSRHR